MYTSTTTSANSPLMIGLTVGIFAIVAIVMIVIGIRRRDEVFEGEVIDKNIIETMNNNMPMNNTNNMNNGITIINGGMGNNVQHQYTIKVKTTIGKIVNYSISSGMYEIIKIGDTVSKPKGTTDITILSSKQTDNVVASNPDNSISTNSNSTPATFV